MKKIYLISTLFLLFTCLGVKAQTFGNGGNGPDHLGEFYTIHVNLTSDYRDGLYASYPFPHPPENLGPMQYNNGYPMTYDNTYFRCIGPGRPYVTVYGGEPVLHLDLYNLETDVNVEENDWMAHPIVETLVDLPVQKTVYSYGSGPYQCYYTLRISISKY